MKPPSQELLQEFQDVKPQDPSGDARPRPCDQQTSRSDIRPRRSDQQDSRRDSRPRLSSRFRDLVHFLNTTAFIFRSAVREIFDESAYARFLARRQIASSAQAYAEFLHENECTRSRRPRCC